MLLIAKDHEKASMLQNFSPGFMRVCSISEGLLDAQPRKKPRAKSERSCRKKPQAKSEPRVFHSVFQHERPDNRLLGYFFANY